MSQDYNNGFCIHTTTGNRIFDENKTGSLTNRLASDTTVLQKAVTVNVSMGLRFHLVLGSIGILMWTSWKLTLLMLAVVPIVAVGAGFYGRMLRRISKEVQDLLAEATSIAEESISGIRTVRAFAREKQEAQRYEDAVETALKEPNIEHFWAQHFKD